MAATPALQEELDTLLRGSSAKRAPEVNAALATTAEHLRAAGAIERALGVGDTAPEFTLPNALGKEISMGDLLESWPRRPRLVPRQLVTVLQPADAGVSGSVA